MIIMPYGWPRPSLQLTGQADFWHLTARPDTPDRPLSVLRVAVAFEAPGLPPVAEKPEHQSLLGSSTWTGLSAPSPTMPPPRRRGSVPSPSAALRALVPEA